MTEPAVERFRAALELHETGLAMKRQQLRRQHPELDDAAIENLLQEWLADRPPDYSPT